MTHAELIRGARAAIDALGTWEVNDGTIEIRGDDLAVSDLDHATPYEVALALSRWLQTDAIDFRQPVDPHGMIEDYGCDTCGHGSLVLVRGAALL